MDVNFIKKLLSDSTGKLIRTRLTNMWLYNNHHDVFVFINSKYPSHNHFKTKLYMVLNGLEKIPKCFCEKNDAKFKNNTIGFITHCSKECKYNDVRINEKRNITNQNRYGAISSFSNEKVKEKHKQRLIEKYGVDHVSKIPGISEKRKITNLQKYGTYTSSINEEVKNKLRETKKNNLIKKYKEFFNIDFIRKDHEGWIVVVKNYCSKHDDFEISLHNLNQRYFKYGIDNICTRCHPIGEMYTSSYEEKLIYFLDDNRVQYIRNDKKILSGHHLDFLIPTKNLAIEFNGEYSHSDLFKDRNYHKNKTDVCLEKGIQLIHIWESDAVLKWDIVKSILLNKLKIEDDIHKIYGRHCEVREITKLTADKFMEENHLQGMCVSKYRCGLFFENELVSVMTFGSTRKNTNTKKEIGKYELLRFSNKLNYRIIGGAGKLLKWFERTYKPEKIISFASRDISNGSLYEQLGFKLIKITDVGYWWFNKRKYNRYQFRKNKLIKLYPEYGDLTEDVIMKNKLKYYKVYNSGNLLYEKTV